MTLMTLIFTDKRKIKKSVVAQMMLNTEKKIRYILNSL
jgi:hypothetical protein